MLQFPRVTHSRESAFGAPETPEQPMRCSDMSKEERTKIWKMFATNSPPRHRVHGDPERVIFRNYFHEQRDRVVLAEINSKKSKNRETVIGK